MKKLLVFSALLSVVLFLPSQRALAQVSCSTPRVVPAPITYSCTMQNFDYLSTFVNTTGLFSTTGNSSQVPRIPSSFSINYSWDSLSGLGTYLIVNVYTPSGSLSNQYMFGFGSFLQSPAVDNGNGVQTAQIAVSGWPSEFRLELVQYNSFYGVTQDSISLQLFN